MNLAIPKMAKIAIFGDFDQRNLKIVTFFKFSTKSKIELTKILRILVKIRKKPENPEKSYPEKVG